MKRVRYYFVARMIKFFLLLAVMFIIVVTTFNLYLSVFKDKPYIKFDNGAILGDATLGYHLNARMHVDIPDTVNVYGNGFRNIYSSFPDDVEGKASDLKRGKPLDQIENKITNHEDTTVKISNTIVVTGNVMVKVWSENKLQNLYWACMEQLNAVLIVVFILILIKLTNRYLTNEIFMPRTFKLVSFLGILMIVSELLKVVAGMINMFMLQHPRLHMSSILHQKTLNFVNLSIDFTGVASYSNIIIGGFIILLSQVLKEAVLAKQENELTI